MACAATMGELCQRMIKPGNVNNQVTAKLATVAKAYDCHLIQGILMHQVNHIGNRT